MVKVLSPKIMIAYDSAPYDIFEICYQNKLEVIQFKSEIAQYFTSKKEVIVQVVISEI